MMFLLSTVVCFHLLKAPHLLALKLSNVLNPEIDKKKLRKTSFVRAIVIDQTQYFVFVKKIITGKLSLECLLN
jgi:hypothetical protein